MKVIRALAFGVPEPSEVPEHSWDKIVLVHPEDPSIAFELPR